MSTEHEADDGIIFLRELFNLGDIQIKRLGSHNYDIYMLGHLVLWCLFDGKHIRLARPNNMSIRKKFSIEDKSISKIREYVESFWVEEYIRLSEIKDS